MSYSQSVHRRVQQARPGSFVPMTAQDVTVATEIEEAPPVAKPSLEVGGRLLGIVPRNIDEIFRLASAIAKSGMAPKDMNTPEKLTVAIMTGLELGLPPMFAINKIAVINGRPTLWGDAIPGLLLSRGCKIDETIAGAGETLAATCIVTRPNGASITRTFAVKDAKKAGLWGKAGPWTQYPERMLAMRARAFAARDGAADILGGLYLREEIDDTPAEPVDITPPVKVKGWRNGRKTSAECKRDGTDQTFNEIRRQIAGASALDFLAQIPRVYEEELRTMYPRWSFEIAKDYELKWEDLGGDPTECPYQAEEEHG
jgi:hypothetical protein